MAELVSKRYAKALFDAGIELDKIKEINRDIEFIEMAFKSENQLIQILSHPKISKDEKKSLLENIFEERILVESLNFLYILMDKRRERELFLIIEEFKKLYNEYAGILNVVAVTAVSMEEVSRIKLANVLKFKLNKEINLINKVDKSIIGGVILKLENKIIDNTILSQLKSMETYIKGV